jgi:hypothetical protein
MLYGYGHDLACIFFYLRHIFNVVYFMCVYIFVPIPVVERSKARVYGCSLAGIADSNPAGDMDVFLL